MAGGSLELYEYPSEIVSLPEVRTRVIGLVRREPGSIKNPKAPAATRAIDEAF